MGEMADNPKRVGRPTKPPREGERVPLGFRITPDLKLKLEDAARKSGRSQSQEAEFRLESTFQHDEQLGRLMSKMRDVAEQALKNDAAIKEVAAKVAKLKASK
jgi:hypothetical protein